MISQVQSYRLLLFPYFSRQTSRQETYRCLFVLLKILNSIVWSACHGWRHGKHLLWRESMKVMSPTQYDCYYYYYYYHYFTTIATTISTIITIPTQSFSKLSKLTVAWLQFSVWILMASIMWNVHFPVWSLIQGSWYSGSMHHDTPRASLEAIIRIKSSKFHFIL